MSQLEEIKARAEIAGEGPWEAHLSSNRKWMLILANSGTADESRIGKVADDDDAEFIAHARMDVPKLIAALEAVEEKLKWLDAIQAEPTIWRHNVNAGGTAFVLREAITEALQ